MLQVLSLQQNGLFQQTSTAAIPNGSLPSQFAPEMRTMLNRFVDTVNNPTLANSCRVADGKAHHNVLSIAEQDETLLQFNEPDFHRLSLQVILQKLFLINQALELISEIRADQHSGADGPDEKTLANAEYLLLRLQGILQSVTVDKSWKLIREELQKLHELHSQTGGDRSCCEYSSGIPPPSTTWPWSIKPSLAVLWGVCWMFANASTNTQTVPNWDESQVKMEEFTQYPVGSSGASDLSNWPTRQDWDLGNSTAVQSSAEMQQSLAAPTSAQYTSNSNHNESWRQMYGGASLANHMGGQGSSSAATASSSLAPAPTLRVPNLQPPNHVLSSGSGRIQSSPLLTPLAMHGQARYSNTSAALPPHPSGQLSVSPQAASLDNLSHHHHHQHLRALSASALSSASGVSSNTLLSPITPWSSSRLATTSEQQQGLGIKHLSPGSASPYRPYNSLLHGSASTRFNSPATTCSPASSQPLFTAATGTWSSVSQPNSRQNSYTYYKDPTSTTPSTPGYLNRHSFDGALPNLVLQPDFARHNQALNSGNFSDYSGSLNISALSYPSSPAHNMDSITADAVLAARTVADLSNAAAAAAATNGSHLDDSMEDALDGFSSRRGHTHKRNEEPLRDDTGKMICRFQNSCSGLTFERKCEWSKHMDKHERPYKCEAPGCEKLQGFTYSGGLLRHQREVHKMHGGTKEPLHCPFENCKRAGGQGFTRKENLQEHIRRVHRRNTEGLEILAGSKRDLETLELTDPLLRSELGGQDDSLVEDVGAENIDPSVSLTPGTPNPSKRRRIHLNGTPVESSLDGQTVEDFRLVAKRLQEQNSTLTKQNDQLRREVQALSERMSKIEGYIGRRMLEELNPEEPEQV